MEKCITYSLLALVAIVMVWILATALTLSNAILAIILLAAIVGFILWGNR